MRNKIPKLPDKHGHFGPYGGRYLPETLMSALLQLQDAYSQAKKSKSFKEEFEHYLRNFAGRPTPLTQAKRLAKAIGVKNVFLKREDLAHTGSHKINNTIGQVLLTRRMGKKRVIAETGAGQHGVATATVCALFGIQCVVYMGEEDVHRQELNVFRMKLLGAQVVPVKCGSRTLKDAVNEAIRDWVTNVKDTHYIIGSVIGPHPYPEMVRNFQSVIGMEALKQLSLQKQNHPDYAIACVGGGSNSIGLFHPLLGTRAKLIGVEAAGRGLGTKLHAATLSKGRIGVLHGCKTEILQNRDGQIDLAHSISAGLDYPGVGPEHAYLKSIKRARYVAITDDQALEGMRLLSRLEGIIPALETSHAIAYAWHQRKMFKRSDNILICLSGRGDKDVNQVSKIMNL